MVYQPPVGARDLFPLEVAQKRWIEERVQQVFHGWGYHRIITSTLERLETLMAGDAVQPSTVIQLQVDEQVLGLRPELTASIARAAVTRMAGVTHPQRLYYNANVFRRALAGSHNRQLEFYHAGVELLGSEGGVADAEILLLLADCIRHLGIGQWHLVLGEAGLTRSLLSAFPEALREAVREAIANLDRIALETLPLSAELRDRALFILDLRGRPADVLQRISSLDLDAQQRATVSNLKTLLDLLQESLTAQQHPQFSLILDLSLIQTFDYYTGIFFEVVSSGTGERRILGRGGRYDHLLGLYHPQAETYPGVGFVLHIDDLHQMLLPTGQLPSRTPPSHWLIVPVSNQAYAAAFTYAKKIRESAHLVRVEMKLKIGEPADKVHEYARRRGISQIAWIDDQGLPQIETVGQ
ncbi:ATP phosphoribosyltransferase regulatory subunit [Oculatella sp. LEGE 06141]|uniref:ATP phosphoribosyltransferase regulatory subunit n=1 Tax=Oculatella sp. LEGE 06141 TaxID=1828648 RepID=UPI00187E0584|nr:ATP phosphoribosyltransferase regulatory subunit [Oculatella sp. LEGE 06141]MBE9181217.1 ATP phosphoribosyltransferase regulatory subunit [Oculatella sp. LEGE 06141]